MLLRPFPRRRVPRQPACALAILTAGMALFCANALASGATSSVYYVDGGTNGVLCSDAYSAAQAQSAATPWCTVSNAVRNVPSGATIQVAPATYHEAVTLTSKDDGVTLEGSGGSPPVIDGDNTRSFGISLTGGVHDVTINGFELQNFYDDPGSGRSVGLLGLDTYDDTIENNVVHAVHGAGPYEYGIILGTNDSPGLVHDVDVKHNTVYDVGPGGSAMGIWLLASKNMTVEDNEVYLVRMEGIRDWLGLGNSLTGNRVFLNWSGVTFEGAVGDLADNNVSYSNVNGFVLKHVSAASSLSMWHLPSGEWTRVWHNTTYGNTHADIALGQNPPNEDYIDVEDNVFADPGDVHIHDFPSVRGPHIIVDHDAYSSGHAPVYYAGWTADHAPRYSTLSELQAALGWEKHGQTMAAPFLASSAADGSADTSAATSGTALPDAFGAQTGAANVPPATAGWTRYSASVVRSTPEPWWLPPSGASDGVDDTYWMSTDYNTNASVTFDLSAPKPVDLFVLDLFDATDPRSPKGYSIQVSTDNVHYTTVLSGTNPDDDGSSYKYVLSSPVIARYVRYNMASSFGGSTLLFSDFGIGQLN